MKSLDISQLEETIFLQNVADTWKSALKTDKKVYILSPYITSVIEILITNPNNCEIYTTFEFRNFLSGGSDIKTLKKLILKRVKIYSIPKLHAKIVLVSEAFVSIGSQNITNNGTKNKEATVVSKEKEIVRFVEDKIEKWVVERKPISLEMLDDVEKRINLIQENYNKLQTDINESDKYVKEQEEIRVKEYQEGLETISQLKKTKEFVRGKFDTIGKNLLYAFVPTSSTNLLNWKIDQDLINLERLTMYPALNETTGKFAWVRIGEGRISKYQQRNFSNNLKIDNRNFEVMIKANWDETTLKSFNVEVLLSYSDVSLPYDQFRIIVWFDTKKVEIKDIQIIEGKNSSLLDLLKNKEKSLKKSILERIIRPASKKEYPLSSLNEADSFLEKWKRYELRIGVINEKPILIFKKTD